MEPSTSPSSIQTGSLTRLRPFHSLRESVQGVAVAADNIFGLFHFLLEGGVVGRELVSSVWGFNQKKDGRLRRL